MDTFFHIVKIYALKKEMDSANKQHLQTVEQSVNRRIENAKLFPMKAFLTLFEKYYDQYIFILLHFSIKIYVLHCMSF